MPGQGAQIYNPEVQLQMSQFSNLNQTKSVKQSSNLRSSSKNKALRTSMGEDRISKQRNPFNKETPTKMPDNFTSIHQTNNSKANSQYKESPQVKMSGSVRFSRMTQKSSNSEGFINNYFNWDEHNLETSEAVPEKKRNKSKFGKKESGQNERIRGKQCKKKSTIETDRMRSIQSAKELLNFSSCEENGQLYRNGANMRGVPVPTKRSIKRSMTCKNIHKSRLRVSSMSKPLGQHRDGGSQSQSPGKPTKVMKRQKTMKEKMFTNEELLRAIDPKRKAERSAKRESDEDERRLPLAKQKTKKKKTKPKRADSRIKRGSMASQKNPNPSTKAYLKRKSEKRVSSQQNDRMKTKLQRVKPKIDTGLRRNPEKYLEEFKLIENERKKKDLALERPVLPRVDLEVAASIARLGALESLETHFTLYQPKSIHLDKIVQKTVHDAPTRQSAFKIEEHFPKSILQTMRRYGVALKRRQSDFNQNRNRPSRPRRSQRSKRPKRPNRAKRRQLMRPKKAVKKRADKVVDVKRQGKNESRSKKKLGFSTAKSVLKSQAQKSRLESENKRIAKFGKSKNKKIVDSKTEKNENLEKVQNKPNRKVNTMTRLNSNLVFKDFEFEQENISQDKSVVTRHLLNQRQFTAQINDISDVKNYVYQFKKTRIPQGARPKAEDESANQIENIDMCISQTPNKKNLNEIQNVQNVVLSGDNYFTPKRVSNEAESNKTNSNLEQLARKKIKSGNSLSKLITSNAKSQGFQNMSEIQNKIYDSSSQNGVSQSKSITNNRPFQHDTTESYFAHNYPTPANKYKSYRAHPGHSDSKKKVNTSLEPRSLGTNKLRSQKKNSTKWKLSNIKAKSKAGAMYKAKTHSQRSRFKKLKNANGKISPFAISNGAGKPQKAKLTNVKKTEKKPISRANKLYQALGAKPKSSRLSFIGPKKHLSLPKKVAGRSSQKKHLAKLTQRDSDNKKKMLESVGSIEQPNKKGGKQPDEVSEKSNYFTSIFHKSPAQEQKNKSSSKKGRVTRGSRKYLRYSASQRSGKTNEKSRSSQYNFLKTDVGKDAQVSAEQGAPKDKNKKFGVGSTKKKFSGLRKNLFGRSKRFLNTNK